VNHIDDADIATLRNILHRLYDATRIPDGERRDLATIMHLILDRIVTAEVEVKEPEHG
jgi:hypothetical protein